VVRYVPLATAVSVGGRQLPNHHSGERSIDMSVYIYIYIYMCVYVCVHLYIHVCLHIYIVEWRAMYRSPLPFLLEGDNYLITIQVRDRSIHIYIYMSIYICICMDMYVCMMYVFL